MVIYGSVISLVMNSLSGSRKFRIAINLRLPKDFLKSQIFKFIYFAFLTPKRRIPNF